VNDIEDFFKIDGVTNNQQQSQFKHRKKKVLSNVYALVTFTDWVVELLG
jgi:hypothetical protein